MRKGFYSPLMVLLISLCFSTSLYAQEGRRNDITINSNYPITMEGTFIENYTGIFDIGVQYGRNITRNLYAGVSVNYSRYKLNWFNTVLSITKPRFLIGYGIPIIQKVDLFAMVGSGYSWLSFRNEDLDFLDKENGLNLIPSLQINYKITELFLLGFQASYDYIWGISVEKRFDIPYNTRIRCVNVGLALKALF